MPRDETVNRSHPQCAGSESRSPILSPTYTQGWLGKEASAVAATVSAWSLQTWGTRLSSRRSGPEHILLLRDFTWEAS